MWVCKTIARSPTSRMADRDEIECLVEPGSAKGEVGGGDSRDETVVEATGDPQRAVDAVPSEPEGEVVYAKLARVEQPPDHDRGEVGLEQGPVLVEGVLAQVPRIVRLLGAGRGEREPVRSGD